MQAHQTVSGGLSNFRKSFIAAAVATATTWVVGASQLLAAATPVTNAGFEQPTYADGQGGAFSGAQDIPGWNKIFGGSNIGGVTYQSDETVSKGAYYAGENNTVSFFTNLGSDYTGGFGSPGEYAGATQDLAATIQPNTRYTLSADVAARNDLNFPTIGNGYNTGDLRFSFGITGNPPGVSFVNNLTTPSGAIIPMPPTNGSSSVRWSVSFDTGPDPSFNGTSYVGSQIYLAMAMLADPNFQAGRGAILDNVAVDVSPIPEPATAGLLAAGSLLLAGRRRRSA